jgi:sigma-B regulation protein RsbU (phosphoserine phosphatase)
VAQLERNEAYRQLAESQQRMAEELAQAARYVQSLLPAKLADGRVSIDWRFVPSTQLGGDAFGYNWLDPGRLAIYLLDVSGHGVGSALLAVSALNVLSNRSLPQADFHDPASVMQALSQVFEMSRHGGKYFTLWYGVYDVATRRLTFSGGGHPPALLVHGATPADARLQELQPDGPVIGLGAMLPFANTIVELAPFARLLLYSDGAVEIAKPGGEMSTYEEFTSFITARCMQDDLMESVLQRARQVGGKDILADDCSLMQVEFRLE